MGSMTPSLQLAVLAYSQNNRSLTLNAQMAAIDAAWTEFTSNTLTGDYSVPQTKITENFLLEFAGSPASGPTVNLSDSTLPGVPIGPRFIAVKNSLTSSPAVSITFKGGTQTATASVSSDGFVHLLWYDGVGKVYLVI